MPNYPKPFLQSNTLATNAQEDSLIQNLANYDNISSSQQELVNSYMKPKTDKKKISIPDASAKIATTLQLINAFVPEDPIDRFHVVQPQTTYNPNAYGTGSQAIMKDGGTLSKGKAKEMLKDGTAHGKKLTKKQKRYFGMVAAGKADMGLSIGDPTTPPKQATSLVDIDSQYSRASDVVNLALTTGGNPLATQQGRLLRSSTANLLGEQGSRDLIDSIIVHNSNPANAALSPEERLKSYYDTPNRNANVQSYQQKIKTIGYSPLESYRTSPNIDVNQQLGRPVAKMANGGTVSDTIQFKGPSHEDGGIPISYGGKKVEVEGSETAFQDQQNNLHIMGNMRVPGTKQKFKSVSKAIMEKEKEYNGLVDKGVDLVNNVDPQDRFDRLKFNAGRIMMEGGSMGKIDLSSKKEGLAQLQNQLLATAQEFNLDPEALSEGKQKKAKNGATIMARAGDSLTDPPTKKKQSVAVRHNNPGNIKYGKFAIEHGAVKGDPATDGGNFAKFPDVQSGLQALRGLLQTSGYKDLTVPQAIKRWTNQSGYNIDISKFKDSKVGDLRGEQIDALVNVITSGEDGKYYTDNMKPSLPKTPVTTRTTPTPNVNVPRVKLPDTPFNYLPPTTITPREYIPDPSGSIKPPVERNIPSNAKPFDLAQVLPEIMAFGNNQEEPVPIQQYNPTLYSPYQVSFQDRRNDNQSTFNAITRSLNDNPLALTSAAAQKYQADSSVGAEEFRTNQGISNQVTNQNVSLLNDAQLKNLQLADTQMVRQSQAKSNTKAQNQVIANSISGKYLQNSQENQKLALYENLYDYRFTDKNNDGIAGEATYMGPDAQFDFGTPAPSTEGATSTYSRMRKVMDAAGNVKQTQISTPSLMEQEKIRLENEKKRKDMPLLNIQKLFRK